MERMTAAAGLPFSFTYPSVPPPPLFFLFLPHRRIPCLPGHGVGRAPPPSQPFSSRLLLPPPCSTRTCYPAISCLSRCLAGWPRHGVRWGRKSRMFPAPPCFMPGRDCQALRDRADGIAGSRAARWWQGKAAEWLGQWGFFSHSWVNTGRWEVLWRHPPHTVPQWSMG